MARFYDIAPADLVLGSPLAGRQGGCNVDVTYAGAKCAVQLPYMRTLGGVRTHTDPYLKFTLDLGLESPHNAAASDLASWLAELDGHVRRQGLLNSEAWFGAACTEEEVDEMFCPASRPTHLRLTMGTSGGACAVPFFAPDTSTQLQLEEVTSGSEVACLVELDRVWMYNGRFGLKLKPLQCMVRASQGGSAFRPDTAPPGAPTPLAASGPATSERSCQRADLPGPASMFRTEAT